MAFGNYCFEKAKEIEYNTKVLFVRNLEAKEIEQCMGFIMKVVVSVLDHPNKQKAFQYFDKEKRILDEIKINTLLSKSLGTDSYVKPPSI